MKRALLGSLLSCMLVGQMFAANNCINFLTGAAMVAGPSIACGSYFANRLSEKGKFGLTKNYATGVLVGGLATCAVGGLIAYNYDMGGGAFKAGLATGATVSGASCLLPAILNLLFIAAH